MLKLVIVDRNVAARVCPIRSVSSYVTSRVTPRTETGTPFTASISGMNVSTTSARYGCSPGGDTANPRIRPDVIVPRAEFWNMGVWCTSMSARSNVELQMKLPVGRYRLNRTMFESLKNSPISTDDELPVALEGRIKEEFPVPSSSPVMTPAMTFASLTDCSVVEAIIRSSSDFADEILMEIATPRNVRLATTRNSPVSRNLPTPSELAILAGVRAIFVGYNMAEGVTPVTYSLAWQ